MTNMLHTKILFKTTYEKLFLIEALLKEHVLGGCFSDEFYFEQLKDDLFTFSFVVSEDDLYTPYTDLIFALNYASEIIMFDSYVEKNGIIGSIHRHEGQKFFSYFVDDKREFEKREIVNSCFDDEDWLKFPIYNVGKKCTIKTKLFGLEKTFEVCINNLNYGVNQKIEKVFMIKDGTEVELCNMCENRLACVVNDTKCNFKTM